MAETGHTLNIFADNVIDHKTSRSDGWRSHNMFGYHANYPRTAGVIIGMSENSPFKGLHIDLSPCPQDNTCDPFFCNRILIDESLQEIRNLMRIHDYSTIRCVDLFKDREVGKDVVEYITGELLRFLEEYDEIE